ncbi:MAG: UDP-3-O-(3-hydroxymyristoyl)glucosamine N-acyltransferase [Porphyromonas sp.]|nr:UDP-3-O-(3-hydroxymyristoyl)glucosamine N-acyltransferase [Porphyromonas sp.]
MQVTLQDIATLLNGTIEGDAQAIVSSFGRIEEAVEGQITFLSNPKYEPYIYQTKASAVLVPNNFVPAEKVAANLIRVEDPYTALALLMQWASKETTPSYEGVSKESFIHPSVKLPNKCYIAPFVYIAEEVVLGEGCSIYPHSYIGKGCKIGANAIIHSHVSIYPECEIGDRCILHAGTVIGADGFGFAPSESGYTKIPQLGNVVIEDDVEIGANTCIDRAVMGSTRISKGCKLDNLIQVGHNCTIGEHTVMAAQGGMAGSSQIGSWCRTGGQIGIAGHVSVGNHVDMGGQTGILGNIKDGRKLLGSPAMDLSTAMRSFTIIPKLPQLLKRIEELEDKINQISTTSCNNKH